MVDCVIKFGKYFDIIDATVHVAITFLDFILAKNEINQERLKIICAVCLYISCTKLFYNFIL